MPMTWERHPDTDAGVRVLRGVNDQISYLDYAKRAKLSLERAKEVLPNVRRILSHEKILFGVVRGIGLVRLGDSEKVKLPVRRMKQIHGQSKRIIRELDTIENFELLGQDERQQATTYRTIANAIRQQALVKYKAPQVSASATGAPVPNVAALLKKKG